MIIYEEIPTEEKILEEAVLSAKEDLPVKEGILDEVIVEIAPEEITEEVKAFKANMINCHFCGLDINENLTFCPQCGAIIKKE